MQAGKISQALTAWGGIKEEDGQAFWMAVERSCTLRPMVLRQNQELITNQATLTWFVHQACTPATVLRTLEALVQEEQGSGPRAARMRSCLSTRIDSERPMAQAVIYAPPARLRWLFLATVGHTGVPRLNCPAWKDVRRRGKPVCLSATRRFLYI
jgi:hypothetical protein